MISMDITSTQPVDLTSAGSPAPPDALIWLVARYGAARQAIGARFAQGREAEGYQRLAHQLFEQIEAMARPGGRKRTQAAESDAAVVGTDTTDPAAKPASVAYSGPAGGFRADDVDHGKLLAPDGRVIGWLADPDEPSRTHRCRASCPVHGGDPYDGLEQ